jgi:NAD(P) transhydrogenase subunit alpha
MTPERAARQQELLAPHVARADALITTAAVPGRRAPVLVTRAMVEQMSPGSVVVDLAADSGGNVEGVRAGAIVQVGRAQVWGGHNVAAQMPGPASRLYAANVVGLVSLMTYAADDEGPAVFAPDFTDDIVDACCVTYGGAIHHEPTRAAIEGGTA